MTSPDGITWTSRTSAANNFWLSVAYGNGVFAAVSDDGTGNRVMTSGLTGGASATPIPMWMQAIGRDAATATCPAGYTGSWAAWPNSGTGGFVCNKFVPVYGN